MSIPAPTVSVSVFPPESFFGDPCDVVITSSEPFVLDVPGTASVIFDKGNDSVEASFTLKRKDKHVFSASVDVGVLTQDPSNPKVFHYSD